MKLQSTVIIAFLFQGGVLVPSAVVTSQSFEASQTAPSDDRKETRLTGEVTDPTGALIPHASVHVNLTDGSLVRKTESDSSGRFSLTLQAGIYTITLSATGFDPYVRQVRVGQKPLIVDAQLSILAAQTVVQVTATSEELSTAANANKNGIDLKGDELATLSDDDATFQQQLLSLAGDDGSHPQQVYVDGFSDGRIPHKNAIREVKVNENPFSAAYDEMGLGRIEISTKPGTGSIHGSLNLSGDPSAFNSRNPFLQQKEPSYYRLFAVGNLSGPLDKKTTFFVNGDYYNQQNNAIINAQSVDGSGNIYSISEAISDPTKTGESSVRLDRQWSPNNTITGRYEFDRVSEVNNGLTQSVLPSSANNSVLTTQTVQIRNSQFLGANTEIGSRFQWIRTRANEIPISSAATVQVPGTVTTGGSPTQIYKDHQDRLEFQEDAVYQHGKHLYRFGGRYRFYRDANLSTAGFNGTYTFNNLAAYQASILGKPSASEYQVTIGQAAFVATTGDLALWAEDEWQPDKSLTIDLGARYETQSAIPDYADPSPHVGISWAPFRSSRKSSLLVLRVGSGIYYDRFAIANLITAKRQGSPLLQQTYTVRNPGFFGNTVPTPSASWVLTTYRVSPDLRSEYEIDSSATAELSLGKRGALTFTVLNKVQRHQWVSINANAPLRDGTRPFGAAAGNMYEFVSGAEGLGNWFYIDPRLKLSKNVTLSGHFNFKRQTADTFGPNYFASNSFNIHQDYGRSPSDRPYSAYVIVSSAMKWGIRTACFVNARAGEPFNITTGADNNSDSIYNDRPSYATTASDPADVINTIYGNLDLRPQLGEKIIPANLGNSAGPFVSLQLQASKTWELGTRKAATTSPTVLHGKGHPKADPHYAVVLSIEGQNVTNTLSPAPPVGVVTSPFFGRSIASSNNFLSTSAANRTFTAHLSLSF